MQLKKTHFVLALVVFAATPAFAMDHTVQVSPGTSLQFSPASVSIASGDTVTFVNSDAISHNVVSDDGGATFSHGTGTPWSLTTPPLTATITYHCTIHGFAGSNGVPGTGMAGVIVVQPSPVRLQSMDVEP